MLILLDAKYSNDMNVHWHNLILFLHFYYSFVGLKMLYMHLQMVDDHWFPKIVLKQMNVGIGN